LQQGLTGLSKFGPLLFGEDRMRNLMKGGIYGWIKDQFGNSVPVDQSGQPITNTGYGAINPITGMPMMINNPYQGYSNDSYGYAPPSTDIYQGYGNDSYGYVPPQYDAGVVTSPYVDYSTGISPYIPTDYSGFDIADYG